MKNLLLDYISEKYQTSRNQIYEAPSIIDRQIMTVKIALWVMSITHIFYIIEGIYNNRPGYFYNGLGIVTGVVPSYYFLKTNRLEFAKFFCYYPAIIIQVIISCIKIQEGYQNLQAEMALMAFAALPFIFYKFPFNSLSIIINFLLYISVKFFKYSTFPTTLIEFYTELVMAFCVYLAMITLTYFYKLDFVNLNEIKDKLIEQKQIIEFQSEKLKELNSTKDRLFSIIAHDLRGPLSSLKGVMQLLDNEFISKEEFSQLSKRLQENVDNVHGMLENLLLWSLSQMDGIKPNIKAFDLDFVVDETVLLFKEVFTKKNIGLTSNSSLNFQALGDEYQIKTVLRNILNNAIKFTPENGQIKIESRVEKNFINVKVSDTGIGIPKEELPLFFSNPKIKMGTAGEKGTGFGLFLCKELIEKNGGIISVESEFGRGTTIEILLPLMMN